MNLGIFLKSVYPNKLKDYSRDCFLDDLFFPLVEDYKIVDKNGHIYCFGRELASRLFSNKSNIPRAIKKKITPTVFFNKKYIANAKLAFDKSIGETNIFSVSSELCNKFANDGSFERKYIEKLNLFFAEEKYYSSLWLMLCLVSCSENKQGNNYEQKKKIAKVNSANELFFYLSQKEKEKRATYFLGFLLNENNRLTSSNLRELLEILTYCNISIAKEDKLNICRHFFKHWKIEQRISSREYFLKCINEYKRCLGKDASNFQNWEQPINLAYSQIMIDELTNKFAKSKSIDNYADCINLYINYFIGNDFFRTDAFFLNNLKNNNYFLPNYNDRINQSLWEYCYTISKFIGSTILKNDFISFISKNKNKNMKNKTVLDRCDELIKKCLSTAQFYEAVS